MINKKPSVCQRGARFVAVMLLVFVPSVYGQIIPANRRTVWQGNVGVQGGIPNRTSIFQTLNPGATAAQINTAIANCPSGKVVFLSAGTYNLSGTINLTKSNVTLRGAGPGATILKFSGVGGLAYVSMSVSGPFNPQTSTNWTAGYAQGATTITVANTSGFGVGHLVILDQLNDPAYVGGGTEGATDSGNGTDHLQYQLVEITGITGNQVTISPGLYMPNWSSSFSPRMWNATSGGAKLENTGLEDLKIDATGGSAQDNIVIERGENCWVKNIESIQATRSHIKTFRNKNLEIRDSWFHHNAGSGVGSYGILLWTDTADLVENNIFNHISCALLTQSGTSGSVIGYNYNTDNFYGTGSAWMAEGMSANHNAHPCFNLFEGNVGTSWYADYIHGSSSHLTAFRNYYSGKEPGKTNNTHAIIIERYNRYMNIVGNVLGTDGYHDHYEDYNGAITNTAVFKLGYQGTYDQSANDTVAYSTLLRHGNYDYATHSQKWDGGITDHVLPSSLYLASKPSWFGSLTWPPINPASPAGTSGLTIPAGYKFVNGVIPTGTPAPTPTPTATPTPTPNPTATPSPTPTPVPTATPSPLGMSFPSTAGVITNPFVIQRDTISQPTQTVDPALGGRALYTFTVPVAGDYVLSALVNCPDGASNSLFVNIDAEPSASMVWDISVTSGSELRMMSWSPSATPKVWTLTAGTHQLIIVGREANTILGQITFQTPPQMPQGVHLTPP